MSETTDKPGRVGCPREWAKHCRCDGCANDGQIAAHKTTTLRVEAPVCDHCGCRWREPAP